MSNRRTIVCGHLAEEQLQRVRYDGQGGVVTADAGLVPLRLLGYGSNVELHGEHIRDRLEASVPDRFVDLLDGFRRLLSLVADRKFGVENPFAWHTKADVVRGI